MEALKIAFLVTRSGPIGGAQIHVRDLSKALTARGHQAIVLAGGSGSLFDQLETNGISYRRLTHLNSKIRPWTEVRAWREISVHLREIGPDLLSTHSSKAGVLGRFAARSMAFPVVHTAHGWAFASTKPSWERWTFERAERIAARSCQAIIAVSDFDRKQAARAKIRPHLGVIRVHNGVAEGAPQWQAHPQVKPVRIVMVARWSSQKDFRTLIAGLSKTRHRNWSAVLIGGGTRSESLRDLIAKFDLTDRIETLGERHDVEAQLARAQVFVLTSHFEGFPRSILEAMRAGLPVVATRVGGVEEAVVDGLTGRLVARHSSQQVANALEELIEDEELRGRMGRAARQRYQQEFRLERMVAETEEVYRLLIDPQSSMLS